MCKVAALPDLREEVQGSRFLGMFRLGREG